MKSTLRRAAAVVLAAALISPHVAVAAPQARDRDHDKSGRIVIVIKKIQKLFGISTNDDLPQPPIPKP